MKIEEELYRQILDHAAEEYPSEACGVIVNNVYIPITNVLENPDEGFLMDSIEYLNCIKLGKIQAIVHSHPDGTTEPSEMDTQVATVFDAPWIIMSFPEGDIKVLTND